MSWSTHLKQLHDMVLEEEPAAKPQTAQSMLPQTTIHPLPLSTNQAPAPVHAVGQNAVQPTPTVGVNITNAAAITRLRTKLDSESVNKYQSTLAALSATIPDENARVKTALSVLGTMANLTAGDLLSAYQAQSAALVQEAALFKSDLDAHTTTEIGGRNTAMASFDKEIAALKAQIESLTEQRNNLAGEIVVATGKVQAAEAGFNSAVETLHCEINAAVDRLNSVNSAGQPAAPIAAGC